MSKRVRLELVEGASAKFWEMSVTGSTLTTTWGRIGAEGQSKTKTFSSSASASLAGEKLLAEKTGKGYRPATAKATKKPRSSAAAKTTAKAGASAAAKTTAKVKSGASAAASDTMRASGEALGKLAAAIAGVVKKPFSPRFALEWQACTIKTHDGYFMVGEPFGGENQIANQNGAPAEVFHLVDRAAARGGTIIGVRLGPKPAVEWRLHEPIAVKSRRYGVRSPGYSYGARKRDAKTAGTKTSDEDTMHLVLAGKVKSIATLVGLDGDGWPACYLLGDALRPEVFAAKAMTKDVFARRDVRATQDELRGLGVAVAARSKKPVSPRFRLEPMPGKLRTAMLAYGDPHRKQGLLKLPAQALVTFFRVVDLLSYGDGYGAWIYGARLGAGPAVRWQHLRTIKVKHSCFGFWSPGFPTEDVTYEGFYTHGDLSAAIGDTHSTAEDSRTCSVVLGLDAAGQPAVMLLGNGLIPEVYVHKQARR